ncbi:MAG TPA: ABC transporter permease [Termitinemataceae bacterium]|nr:ABC transporter permease [Termitinemataceae bacterium]HOM24222.1 ABC transporter permease [Termitinemataceae bacterium]HPQ01313.1 ABC transporter permease [Termitinemataceae bacterium]
MKDFFVALNDFWKEFKKEKTGLIGLGIVIVSLLIIILEPLLLPWKDTNTKWRNIDYWQDNTPSAPPVWTNWFTPTKATPTSRIDEYTHEIDDEEAGFVSETYTFTYHYDTDSSPQDIIFHMTGNGTFPLVGEIVRPDGQTIPFAQIYEEGLFDQDIRLSLNNDGKDAAFELLKQYASEEMVEQLSSKSIKSTSVFFGSLSDRSLEAFTPLKGIYQFKITIYRMDEESSIKDPYVIVTGDVSGLLGTDSEKRDLFSGLLAGLKWALAIGIVTSAISVLIGVMYGIISAYFGGWVDTAMQFIYQVFNSIPVLPVLIVSSAIFKPNIYTLIGVMVFFFWTGSVMTVRSMALQIKEETYIEAARALGAGHRRIIFKHMVPLLIPYSFASMALSVPSAIVYESSVSLLGLGDATIVTWGQILHDAIQAGAILKGIWWWVLPPGLLISIMGMSFAFLGFSMDKILHPKLKTR